MVKELAEKKNYVGMIVANICLSILLSYILTVFAAAAIASIGIEIVNADGIFL